jgi:uncharacterized membrane protein YgcG
MNCARAGKMLLLLASLLCLVSAFPAAALDSNVRIVRLSYTSGDVQLDRGEGQGHERAILNMPIVQGSRLWTRGDDALAEVEFEDGSTLRLTPGSTVEFQELSLRGSGEKVTSVDLRNGTAYLDVRNHMGDFRVTTGGQQISVAHPARFRVLSDQGQFKVADYKGNVDVRSGDHQIAIRSGETLTLDLSDPSHYNLAKNIAEGSYDDWNRERENYTQSYNSASTYSADSYYSGFSPAYSYGLADLAYYGNYFYAPGWGWMWRPYYAGAAWNPFMDGSWAWYPQFGYLWISPYPWGWMPYRYGAWNFVPGYGWCWMPATAWNNWLPVTAVNHPPLGWVPVRPPAVAPKPGTPSLVTVGRTSGIVYPPGAARPLPGSSLLSTGGTKGSAIPSTAPPAIASSTTTAPGKPATAPAPPAVRPHHDSGTPHSPPAPSSHPSAPAAAPRSQMSPATEGSHSWGGGEHAGGFSGGGHSSGSGGHAGGHH